MTYVDEVQRNRLIEKVALWQTGDGGDVPKSGNGKAARLVAAQVINISDGRRPCDPPWDIGNEDVAADIVRRLLEKCQEVVNGKRQQQLLAAVFYFVSNDQNMTPVRGSPGEDYARSFEMTFDPVGGRGDEYASPRNDLRFRENQESSAIALGLNAAARATEILASHCQMIAQTLAHEMDDRRTERAQADADRRASDQAARDQWVLMVQALDTKADRDLKTAIGLSELEEKKGMREVRTLLMKEAVPIAGLFANALAQYAGKALGFQPTPLQERFMKILGPVAKDPEKIAEMMVALKLSPEDCQEIIALSQEMNAAQRMLEPSQKAQQIMSGVRSPTLPFQKFKSLPQVAKVFERAERAEVQSRVAGSGGGGQ